MAEPFEIKSGDLVTPLTATLIGGNGAPINLLGETVTVTIVNAYAPYTPLVTAGAVSIVDQSDPNNYGQVVYTFSPGQTDIPGDYLAEFNVISSGQAKIIPGDDYLRITITPSLTSTVAPLVPIVSLGEIETAMMRDFKGREAARADQLAHQLAAILGLWLNRDLIPTEHLGEPHTVSGLDGYLRFEHGPVRSVTSVTLGVGGTPVTDYNTTYLSAQFPAGMYYTVDYWAGDDRPHEAIRNLIIDAVAKSLMVSPAIALGALTSYSVEGTSVAFRSFGGAVSGEGAGRFTVAELGAIRRLKRRVIG